MFENEGKEIKIELQPCIIAQAILLHDRYMNASVFSEDLPEMSFDEFFNQMVVAGMAEFNHTLSENERLTTKTHL